VLAVEYKPENAVFTEKNAFSGRKLALWTGNRAGWPVKRGATGAI
jgi:hypothetical protein